LYEKEKERKTKSDFFGGLFLSSRVLKDTFTSIFVNCQALLANSLVSQIIFKKHTLCLLLPWIWS